MTKKVYRNPSASTRSGIKRTKSKPKPVKKTLPKTLKVAFSAAQIRKAFPNAQAEIVHKLSESEVNNVLAGTPDEIKTKVIDLAQSKGIKGVIKIERRRFSTGSGWNRNTTTRFCIFGFRPYTDAELEAEGPKLVKKENDRRLAAYKSELKKVQDFNKLASSLGQPLMGEPKLPELLKL